MCYYEYNISLLQNRGTEQDREQENRTVQISVPCELVMDLLAQGAILQMQIGPVPLRPDLTSPAPSLSLQIPMY